MVFFSVASDGTCTACICLHKRSKACQQRRLLLRQCSQRLDRWRHASRYVAHGTKPATRRAHLDHCSNNRAWSCLVSGMLKQRSRLHVLRWCQNTKWTWRRQTLWRQSKRRWNGWRQTVRRRSKKRWPCGSPSNIRHLCWSVRHGKGRLDQRLHRRIGER